MANSFYTKTGNPTASSLLDSQVLRDEFSAIEAGLDKLPNLSTTQDNVVEVNSAGTALVATRTFVNLTANQTIGGIKSFSSPPLVPSQSAGDNSTKAANTAYVDAIAALSLNSAAVHAATSKTTPVDADEIGLQDSASSFSLKKLTWANLKSLLQTTLPFLQSGTGAIARTVQDRLKETISVKDFGAIGDGNTHPLSGYYGSLGAAQVIYPHATALTDELDWAATQAAVAYAETLTGTGYLATRTGIEIKFPAGVYLFNKTITVLADSIGFVGASGKGSMLQATIDGIALFTVGDSAYLVRQNFASFADLVFVANVTTSTASTAIRLNRTVGVHIRFCYFVNFYLAINSLASSTTMITNCRFTQINRTVNAAIASFRHQGLDLTGSGITYSPGGGIHITDCEFGGNGADDSMVTSHLLINTIDGLYINSCHFVYCVESVRIAPDGTQANNNITDIFFTGGCYFDEPYNVSGYNVIITGTINYLATSPGIYQNINFSNTLFRGANRAENGCKIAVTDGGAFATNNRKLRNISFDGCYFESLTKSAILIHGTGASKLEPYDIKVTACSFKSNNAGGATSGSGITAECENILITGCIFENDLIAPDYNIVFSLSLAASQFPSFLCQNNDFSFSNCTADTPISYTTIAGARINISGNTFPGAGQEINQTFKTITTSDAPFIIWSKLLDTEGQSGMVKTRVIGANATASQRARYEQSASFFRPQGGTSSSITVVASSAELITGSDAPVVLSLLTGAAWASTTAYAAGVLLTNGGRVYLVMIAGTSSSTAPTFTSGTATNGTCTLGYISTTAANTLALIISGTTATTMNWLADVELLVVP